MRPLTAKDARDMAAIHAESFAPPLGSGGWPALDMATHTQKDLCLGVDHDGALGGFIIVSIAADQAEILTIATAIVSRRRGLARRLLEGVAPELKKQDVRELFLEVAEDNIGAIALYRGAGFIPIGRRPGYYRRAEGRIAALTLSKKV